MSSPLTHEAIGMVGECSKCHGEAVWGKSCCGEGVIIGGELMEDEDAEKHLKTVSGYHKEWTKAQKPKLIQIKESDIVEYLTVCPYCMDPVQTDPHIGCCGEVHAEDACVTKDGECYLDSEYELAL